MIVVSIKALCATCALLGAAGQEAKASSDGARTLFVISNAVLWRGALAGHEIDYAGAEAIRWRLVRSIDNQTGIDALSPLDQSSRADMAQWSDLFDVLDFIAEYRHQEHFRRRDYSLTESFLSSPAYGNFDCIFVVNYRGYQRSFATSLLERSIELATGEQRPHYLANEVEITPITGQTRVVHEGRLLDAKGELPDAVVPHFTERLIQEASRFDGCLELG